jgi:hypothetical protein
LGSISSNLRIHNLLKYILDWRMSGSHHILMVA